MTRYNRPPSYGDTEDERYPENWNALRYNIFKEYGFKCAKCQKYSKGDLQLHHIIPLSKGGTNDRGNLIPLCSKCHEYIHYYNRGKI